jgi:hypothetical protein
MVLANEYFWLEPALLAVAVVFVVDLLGNLIEEISCPKQLRVGMSAVCAQVRFS